LIHELIVGSSMTVDEKNIEIFDNLIENVGTTEVTETISKTGESCESLNASNWSSHLNKRSKDCIVFDRECDFIASHFSEFDLDVSRSLDFSILKDI
jgi:hypothetical protein